MKRRIAVLLMLGIFPWATVHAAEQTTVFTVKTNVQAVCAVTATDLNFGNYSAQQTSVDTSVSVTCTVGTGYNIGLSAGTNATTVTDRKMKLTTGPDVLGYQLYRTSSYNDPWGFTVGTDTVAGSGTGSAFSHTIFGRLPGGQKVPAGSYQDVITVTVTY